MPRGGIVGDGVGQGNRVDDRPAALGVDGDDAATTGQWYREFGRAHSVVPGRDRVTVGADIGVGDQPSRRRSIGGHDHGCGFDATVVGVDVVRSNGARRHSQADRPLRQSFVQLVGYRLHALRRQGGSPLHETREHHVHEAARGHQMWFQENAGEERLDDLVDQRGVYPGPGQGHLRRFVGSRVELSTVQSCDAPGVGEELRLARHRADGPRQCRHMPGAR